MRHRSVYVDTAPRPAYPSLHSPTTKKVKCASIAVSVADALMPHGQQQLPPCSIRLQQPVQVPLITWQASWHLTCVVFTLLPSHLPQPVRTSSLVLGGFLSVVSLGLLLSGLWMSMTNSTRPLHRAMAKQYKQSELTANTSSCFSFLSIKQQVSEKACWLGRA